MWGPHVSHAGLLLSCFWRWRRLLACGADAGRPNRGLGVAECCGPRLHCTQRKRSRSQRTRKYGVQITASSVRCRTGLVLKERTVEWWSGPASLDRSDGSKSESRRVDEGRCARQLGREASRVDLRLGGQRAAPLRARASLATPWPEEPVRATADQMQIVTNTLRTRSRPEPTVGGVWPSCGRAPTQAMRCDASPTPRPIPLVLRSPGRARASLALQQL